MTWLYLMIFNVITNGTCLYLIKSVSQKDNQDHNSINFVWLLFSSLAILPFFIFNLTSQPGLFSSIIGIGYFLITTVINIFAFNFYTQALSLNDLSVVGPLDNLRPFFVILFSLLFLGQRPTTNIVLGIVLIVAGAFILQLKRNLPEFLKTIVRSKATLFIIFSTSLFALGTIFDKKTLSYTSPSIDAFLGTLILAIVFGVKFYKKSGQIFSKKIFHPRLIVAGILFGIGILAFVTSLKLASPNVVVPIQMTRSLYMAFLGFILLKEKGYLRKTLSAIIMILGVILLTHNLIY